MSATPIPRTLLLAAYGDVDGLVAADKPPGREPVETRLVSDQRLDELMDATSGRWPAASGSTGSAR